MARILALTTEFLPFRGGIGAVALGLARGAAALGHEVVVLAPDFGRDQGAADAELPFAVRRFPGKSVSMVSTDGIVRHTRRVRRAIRQLSPDIVHAVDPPSQMALAMLARLRLVARHFHTVHGTELLRFRDELFPRLWIGGALGRATSICAVSGVVGDLLLAMSHCDPGRVFVSHPGIAEEWLATARSERAAVRSAWNIGLSDVVLLTLARRVPEKGHLEVIAALGRLPAAARERLTYLVAGTGPDSYAQALTDAAQREGVRLRLVGKVPDQAAVELMDAADAFVMLSQETPTRMEGLGLAYIEAAARGVPSLARATGGVREAVLDGQTGIVLSAAADAEATAAAVQRLAFDEGLRRRLAAGAARFGREFTYERHAREVYDRFLAC